MPQSVSNETPDRSKTDKSLDKERRNADEVLAERKVTIEAKADRVVEVAREHADAVLLEARDKADDLLQVARPIPEIRAAIDTERKRRIAPSRTNARWPTRPWRRNAHRMPGTCSRCCRSSASAPTARC